jgi:hypothetical protein
MSKFTFELVNHPAQADHPLRPGHKLFDDDGNQVPLFPGSRAVRWEGRMICLVSESGNVAFHDRTLKLPEAVKEACVLFVDETFKKGEFVSEVPEIPPQPEDDE